MSALNLTQLEQEVIDISRRIGAWIKEQRKEFLPSDVEIKGLNNFVSYVDKEAEMQFVHALSQLLPEAGFIAEEGTSNKKGERYNWVIDPLDGTTNFVHGIPLYCTSVALMDKEEVILAVVYEPNTQECFHAQQEKGAKLNGQVIRVSPNESLNTGLLATGFPYDDFDRETEYFSVLQALTKKTRGLRRLGTAALDLAYVAAGRFEAYYEYGLNPWDVAAGSLIVQEAGGHVSDFKGGSDFVFGEEIVATNRHVHSDLMSTIDQLFHKL